jgi:hypothetical protein
MNVEESNRMWVKVVRSNDRATVLIGKNQANERVLISRAKFEAKVYQGDIVSVVAVDAKPNPTATKPARWFGMKPIIVARSTKPNPKDLTQPRILLAEDANPVAWKQAQDEEQDAQPTY